MPTHGNKLGFDTTSQLNQLGTWQQVKTWRTVDPRQPVFAGRYFTQTWPGKKWLWVNGESKGVENPPLAHVVPLQGPGPTPQQNPAGWTRVQGQNPDGTPADSEAVRFWGDADARAVCSRIWDRVKNGDLKFPKSKKVIVYLDIEAADQPGQPGEKLSPDYWYGWASQVWWFPAGGLQYPFYPGIYCTTMHPKDAPGDDLHHRVPNQDVQDALNDPVNNLASRCYGIWASNPEIPGRFAKNFQLDWDNRFDDWKQTVHVIFGFWESSAVVPVRIWQYVVLNALNVDLDETAPLRGDASPDADAVNWMLDIP
jgi:hypothetical protein